MSGRHDFLATHLCINMANAFTRIPSNTADAVRQALSGSFTHQSAGLTSNFPASGASDASDEIGVTTPPANSTASTPFTGTPFALPGTLQAENFDNGGEGVAYSDTSTGNFGGSYRSTDVDVENTVDIQTTQDAGGGYDVGWTAAGEWVKYTVNVPTAGNYNMAFRVASAGAGGTFHLESNGVNKTGALTIANTGGWQTFTTLTVPNVYLAAGQQVLKLVMDSNGSTGGVGNFNWINFTFSATQPPVPAAVTAFAATVASSQEIDLAWTDAVNPAGTMYNVYRSTTSGFTPSSANLFASGVTATSYADSTVSPDQAYYYKVTAINGLGPESTPVAANASTPVSVPIAPFAIASAQEIDLSWSDDINAAGTTYNVYRSTAPNFTASSGTLVGSHLTALSYNDTAVTSGTAYYYQITAVTSQSHESSPLGFGVTAAALTASTVISTTSSLSVTGAVPQSGGSRTYTWSPLTEPAGAPDPFFSGNASATAVNTTATFFRAGAYVLKVTIFDGLLTSTGTVSVQVAQKLNAVFVYPAAATIALGGSYRLNAIALDQFGNPMATQPAITWSTADSTQGTVSSTGLYTAPASGAGPFIVTASATDGAGHFPVGTAQFTIGSAAAASAVPAAVTHLAALGEDGVDVQVTWNAGDATAGGFLIQASSDGGTTFSPLGIAAAGDTSFLATRLCTNMAYVFKVIPFNSAGAGAAVTSAAVTTGGASTAGWYRIGFNDPSHPTATTEPFVAGDKQDVVSGGDSGSLTLTQAALSNGGWVQADSAADAVRQALSGSFTHQSAGLTYSFLSSGAFRYIPDLVLNGQHLGPAIGVQDSFGTASQDGDYNASYIILSVVRDQVVVQATSDQTLYTVPAGSLSVGTFTSADPGSVAGDFTATVAWADGTSSPGVITALGSGVFGVSVTATPTGTSAANYVLTVTHMPTGVADQDFLGAGAPGVNGGVTPNVSTGATPDFQTDISFPPAPTLVNAATRGGVAPTVNSNGALTGGSLPNKFHLEWSATRSYYYWIYYTDNSSKPCQYLAGSLQALGKPHPTLPFDLMFSSLNHKSAGVSTATARFGQAGSNTFYFTVVATTTNTAPTVVHGMLRSGGTASQQFCAPQVFFIAGGGDGDHTSQNEIATQVAALYDNRFGCQMTTFAWNDRLSGTAQNGAATAIAGHITGELASKTPLVLMGQSFGGGQAVGVSSVLTGKHVVSDLDLFDPVSPYQSDVDATPLTLPAGNNIFNASFDPFKAPDPNNSTFNEVHSVFTLPAATQVQHAMDWWAEFNTENVLDPPGPDGKRTGFATGFISHPNDAQNYQFTVQSPFNLTGNPPPNPASLGLVHISQAFNGAVGTVAPPGKQSVLNQIQTQLTGLGWAF